MLVGSLQIEMMANMARLQADMNKANSIVSESMKSIIQMVELAKKALIGFAGVATAGAFMDMVKSNIAAADSLGRLATQAGVTVEALSGLAGVGKLSGTSADTVAGAMNRMTKAMSGADEEGKGAAAALRAMGMNFGDFQKLSPDERMMAVAKAMEGFQDGAGKSAVAMALMGKAGAEMLPYMKDLATVGELHAKVTSEQAAMAKDFDLNLKKVSASSDAWKKELSMGMLPALDDASRAFLGVMNGTGGLREEIVKLSKDGTIEKYVRSAITVLTYFADIIEYVVRVVKVMGEGIGAQVAGVVTIFGGLGQAIKLALSGDFSGAGSALAGAFRESKAIVISYGQSVAETFGAETMGARFRARMEDVKGLSAAIAREDAAKNAAKPKIDDGFNRKVGGEAADRELAAYTQLAKAISDKNAVAELEAQSTEKLLPLQQEAAKFVKNLLEGTLKLTDAHKASITAALEVGIAQEKLNAQRAAEMKQAQAYAEARQALRIKEYNGINEYFLKQTEGFNAAEKGATDALKAEQARHDQFGLSRSQIEELVVAELKLKQTRVTSDSEEYASLQRQIDTREKLVGLMKSDDARATEIASYKSMWESVDRTAHDTFVNIFEGGQDAFTKLTNVLKSTLLDLLYQMTVRKWIFDITASVTGASSGVVGAVAQGAGLTGNANTLSSASSLYSMGTRGYNYITGLFGGGAAGASAGGGLTLGGGSMGMTGSVSGTGMGVSSGSGIGMTGTLGSSTGTSISTGAASSGSMAGFAGIPVIGWIMAGMAASGSAYDAGFRGNSDDHGTTNPINAGLNAEDRLIGQPLGLDGKTSAILSGSSLGSWASYQVFGGHTVTPAGGGLTGTLGMGGAAVQGRTDYTEDHRGFLGSGAYTTHNSTFNDLDKGTADTLNRGVAATFDAVKTYASAIGLSADAVNNFTKDINIDLGGLDADGVKKKIAETFAGFGDDMVTSAYGSVITALARPGETASNTLTRLATDLTVVNQDLKTLGLSMMPLSVDSAKAAAGLVDAAGGLDKLQSAVDFYYSHFYSAAEQNANATSHLNDQFTALGVSMPTTRQGFRDLITSMDTTTPAGQHLTTSLLALAPAFDTVATAAEQANQKFQQSYAAALKDFGTPDEIRSFSISQIQSGLAAGGVNVTADQIAHASRSDAVALYKSYNAAPGATQTAAQHAAQQAILDNASAFASLTPVMNAATEAMVGTGSGGGTGGAGGAVGAADSLANAFQSLTDAIFKEVYRIRGLEAGPGQAGLAYAQSRFTLATAQARAGDQSAAAALPGLSQTLEQLQKDNAHTLQELNLMRGRTANSLETTGNILASQYGLKIPSFDVGTNMIPHDMFAMLHAGEAVIPAAYNPALGGQGGSSGGDVSDALEENNRLLAAILEKATSTDLSNEKIKKVLVAFTHDGQGAVINDDSIDELATAIAAAMA